MCSCQEKALDLTQCLLTPWIIAETVEGTLVTFYDWLHAGEEIKLCLFKSIRSVFIFDVVSLSEQTEAVTKQAKYMWQPGSYVQPLNSDTCWKSQCLCESSCRLLFLQCLATQLTDEIWHYKYPVKCNISIWQSLTVCKAIKYKNPNNTSSEKMKRERERETATLVEAQAYCWSSLELSLHHN